MGEIKAQELILYQITTLLFTLNEISKTLKSIAKSLDRLHNGQIKHDIRGD